MRHSCYLLARSPESNSPKMFFPCDVLLANYRACEEYREESELGFVGEKTKYDCDQK